MHSEETTAGTQGARVKITRKLPGIAQRNEMGEIRFIRGVIIYASVRVQWVETDSKMIGNAHLIGSNFLYWCDACHCSVYEEEILRIGRHACPFCDRPVAPCPVGTKVRLHFRFAQDASWAEWWAEVWEW